MLNFNYNSHSSSSEREEVLFKANLNDFYESQKKLGLTNYKYDEASSNRKYSYAARLVQTNGRMSAGLVLSEDIYCNSCGHKIHFSGETKTLQSLFKAHLEEKRRDLTVYCEMAETVYRLLYQNYHFQIDLLKPQSPDDYLKTLEQTTIRSIALDPRHATKLYHATKYYHVVPIHVDTGVNYRAITAGTEGITKRVYSNDSVYFSHVEFKDFVRKQSKALLYIMVRMNPEQYGFFTYPMKSVKAGDIHNLIDAIDQAGMVKSYRHEKKIIHDYLEAAQKLSKYTQADLEESKDSVCCFTCDYGLYGFEEGEDPLVEFTKHFDMLANRYGIDIHCRTLEKAIAECTRPNVHNSMGTRVLTERPLAQ